MPILRAQRSPSIESTIKALVNQSREPNALDFLKIDNMVAQTAHQGALTDKVRQEVESARQQDTLRADPLEAQRYASLASGAQLPIVQQLQKHLMGATEPGVGPMPTGEAMGDVPVAHPEIQPQQALQARTALASWMANQVATGKTNADQMTQAGGNLQTQGIRAQMAQTPDIPTQNMLATAINQKAREPFQQGALGVLNQETGALSASETAQKPRLHFDPQRGVVVDLDAASARSVVSGGAPLAPSAGASRPQYDASRGVVVDPSTGTASPVTMGGRPLAERSKPLPDRVMKELQEARDNSSVLETLSKSFKPDFAGKGVLGFGADAQLGASSRLGVDREAVEWWRNYKRQSELVERHALFGAALTATEQGQWRMADVGPHMNPEVVKTNLETRARLTKKVLENATQDYIDAGHDAEKIRAIAGRGGKGEALNPEKPAKVDDATRQRALEILRRREAERGGRT